MRGEVARAPGRETRPRGALRAARGCLVALAVTLLAPVALHHAVACGTKITPPQLDATAEVARDAQAYVRKRGRIFEVALSGSPAQIGKQHGSMLREQMIENEGVLLAQFERHVPSLLARTAIVDLARLRFRGADQNFSDARREEIAAQAAAFSPDPYASFLPTYHRFTFLQSLYDISLSFERSPLLGCTSFALADGAFEGGGAVLARNFDFEAGDIFDRGKAVFLVREQGRISYASVAWPGLVGAVTGMNAEGVALVVHGARARNPRPVGEPVVHTMRDALGLAKTADEAVEILAGRTPMVSYLVLIVDAKGRVAVVERAPGEDQTVRWGHRKLGLTNHFEGPLASDPKNLVVESSTSTRERRARLDELLKNLPEGATVERVVQVLRDKDGRSGGRLELGDRRALDALIATHSVIMETTRKKLWVSEGPHLVGRFVRFDLEELLADHGPRPPSGVHELPAVEPGPHEVVAEDPIARDGRYDAWVRAGRPHTREGHTQLEEKRP